MRIAADDEFSRRALLEDGWREIEVLETWSTDEWEEAPDEHEVWMADSGHTEACRRIAFEGFEHDRLHKDELVSDVMADAWKWHGVDVAMDDEDTLVLVAVADAETEMEAAEPVAGFVTCKDGRIGLLAVDAAYRKQGYGASLIEGLFVHVEGPIRAGTQEHNEAARALYRQMGFTVEKRERTFHK